MLFLCGRVHGYEGYEASEVGFCGARRIHAGRATLIVTNAAGGVDADLKPGEIVAISDHLNLTGQSPLSGPNDERIGPRFVDMTAAYAPELLRARDRGGARRRSAIRCGGPSTPAWPARPTRRLRRYGCCGCSGRGLVGMSTVHEVITARHAGLDVLGLSIVANHAAGVIDQRLHHEDVTRAAASAADALGRLVWT